jgi:hypothetical protein
VRLRGGSGAAPSTVWCWVGAYVELAIQVRAGPPQLLEAGAGLRPEFGH